MGHLKRKIERELEAETGDPRIRINSTAYRAKIAKVEADIYGIRTSYRQLQGSGARRTYAATVRKVIPAAATKKSAEGDLASSLDALNQELGLGNY